MAKRKAPKPRYARKPRTICFPFLSLPRELQDEICRLTLSPHVDFTLKDKWRPWPPNKVGDEGDKISLHWKLVIDRTLLLVNQEVSAVARKILHRETSSIDRLVSRSILNGRIIESPSLEFLSLCQRSRLILRSDMQATLRFLASAPLNHVIRSLVVTDRMVFADDYNNRDAWSKKREVQKWTPFTTLLRTYMPGLQEVALFVPGTEEDMEYYCSHAPEEMCRMLEDGTLDVVRFLFGNEFEAEYDIMDWSYVNDAMRPRPKWVVGMKWEEYLELDEALRDAPDRFAMKREHGERTRRWPDGKTVITFRRPA